MAPREPGAITGRDCHRPGGRPGRDRL